MTRDEFYVTIRKMLPPLPKWLTANGTHFKKYFTNLLPVSEQNFQCVPCSCDDDLCAGKGVKYCFCNRIWSRLQNRNEKPVLLQTMTSSTFEHQNQFGKRMLSTESAQSQNDLTKSNPYNPLGPNQIPQYLLHQTLGSGGHNCQICRADPTACLLDNLSIEQSMERNAKNLKEQAYNLLPYLKDSYLEHLVESSRNGPIRLKVLLDDLKNDTHLDDLKNDTHLDYAKVF